MMPNCGATSCYDIPVARIAPWASNRGEGSSARGDVGQEDEGDRREDAKAWRLTFRYGLEILGRTAH